MEKCEAFLIWVPTIAMVMMERVKKSPVTMRFNFMASHSSGSSPLLIILQQLVCARHNELG